MIFPKVVCPSWQAIGGWLVDGHIKPAEQLLQVASPFKEYVPGEQAPDNDMGVGQANPGGHGVQYETPWNTKRRKIDCKTILKNIY